MPSATYNSETKYKTRLSRSCGAADSTLYVDALPTETSDILMIDKDSDENYEIILYTGTTGAGTTANPYRITGCVRGLAISGTSVAAGTGKAHGRVEIGCADVHYYTSLMKAHVDSVQMMPQVASTAALPTTGNTQYDIRWVKNQVAFYYWSIAATSGSTSDWAPVALASTPNASTTVPGKVEEATQSENDAGTAAGASADLFATPAVNAATIQKSSWVYAADAGVSDTYAITVTPTPPAYAAGMKFRFKANTANTGAASLNVSALGAVAIKKNYDQDLVTGDIRANQIIEVVHDGTNFQLVSGDNPYDAKGSIPIGTAAGTKTPLAVGSNNHVLTADSTQSTGVKWAATPKLLAVLNTPVTVTNTTTETTLMTATISANSMSTSNAVQGELYYYNLDSAAGVTNDAYFHLYFGATKVATLTIGNGGQVDGFGRIVFIVSNNGATNSQKGTVFANVAYAGASPLSGTSFYDHDSIGASGLNSSILVDRGTAAIDTTASTTVSIKFEWGNADVGNTVTADHGSITLLA